MLISFVINVIVTAIALVVTANVIPSLVVPEDPGPLLAVALLIGIVNGLLLPIVRLLSLPLRLVTFGLLGIVLNIVGLLGVAWVSGQLDLGFKVGTFPPDITAETIGVALVASVILGLISGVISFLLPRR